MGRKRSKDKKEHKRPLLPVLLPSLRAWALNVLDPGSHGHCVALRCVSDDAIGLRSGRSSNSLLLHTCRQIWVKSRNYRIGHNWAQRREFSAVSTDTHVPQALEAVKGTQQTEPAVEAQRPEGTWHVLSSSGGTVWPEPGTQAGARSTGSFMPSRGICPLAGPSDSHSGF